MSPRSKEARGRRRLALAAAAVAAALVLGVVTVGAFGSTVSSAAFTGTSGTVTAGGTLYAKQGGQLTLTVKTSADTKCVEITGAHADRQTSNSAKSTWTFTFTAGPGDGVKTVTAAASPNFNANNCTGQSQNPQTASYVLDNTGPVVTGTASPAANGAGWNKSDVTVTWTATDAGSGVATGPSPASETLTANTAGETRTASATDRLGNAGSGSLTIKLDKVGPTISTTQSPQPNVSGWNNSNVTVSITCSDDLSGIKSCTGGGTQVVSTEGAGQTLTATAVDNADNSKSTTVGPINLDKTAPTLTGTVAGGTAGDDGWYRSNVTVHWTCSDALSGIAGGCPADSTIAGEGAGLTATASVADHAGNQQGAVSPAVKIDKTAPTTDASAVNAWNNVDVTVRLTANDALSGVRETRYAVDGGNAQIGTEVAIAEEGTHTLEYWSVDTAGNGEAHKTVKVNIDKTSPTIGHEFAPLPNANGWFKDDVEVKFVCADALSGIARCGPDRVVSTEGQDQDASGEAVDVAGNRALDPATVSLDRTPPTIKASADREPNGAGWYDHDVTVAFACGDALSGVDHCPAAEVLGEGANQSADGTAIDAAGNTAHARLDGVNVDKTAPKLSGAATSPANGNGWYRGDVVVHWTCSDGLSGLAGDCPEDATVRGEGANLSASADVSDRAGNSAHATVDQIAIDRTAPTTAADVPEALESGWYAGPVTVKLVGSDSLSGVESTHYRVDDGAAQDYSGPFELSSKGIHAIHFWSVDRAGNVEDVDSPGHVVTLKIDGVPPRITGTRTPTANVFGWNNAPVTVGFDCSDEESGIAACSPAVTLSNEGAHQSAVGTALDNAGNTSTATVDDVNIDVTAPELAGAATDAPNAAGWYRHDVTVHWTATDALSGIDSATVPADSVIGGEGDDLGAGPVSVADKAGNMASASSPRVRIDRTAPVITGGPLTAPNAYGWYDKAVVVGFECSDALSGPATCPSDKLVSGNGAGQSVMSDAATDLAGNTAEGITVGGINVDGLAPQTTADNQCTRVNGWCTGSTATVVLTASDQAGLSGVKEIRYSVNGGAEKVAPAASVAVDVPLDGSGEARVRFHAVDRAGNSEPDNAVAMRYDNIAPILTHALAPAPNAADWNHDDVTVHFSARDNDGGSGVDDARTTPDVTVADETGGRRIEGEAYDVAGNRGSDAVTVKLDRTAPAISGAVVSGTLGQNGWYVGPVKVHFTCSDALSGVAVCPADVTLTANGGDQSVAGEAIDFAGNRRSVTVGGISIDQEAPEISVGGIAAGGIYTLGAVPAPSCSAKDGVSGAGTCSVSVTGGLANGVGTFTYTATATDRAGNERKVTGTYRVVYRFDGFLQPINDTAHQVGSSTSIFKAGSTVPAKFQLKRADGAVVQANTAPAWPAPVKGGATTAPVDESLYTSTPDVAGSYRWDASGQQYQYNWGTPAAGKGYYHRIAVQLDDGQTYVVNIGLR